MTTTPDEPTTALPGRPPVVDLATWQTARDELLSARRPIPARATPSPRPAAGCRWWSSTGRWRSSDLTARSRSSTCSRAATNWSITPCGTTARRTRGSARAAPSTSRTGAVRLQRPRRLVRRPDPAVERGGFLRRVHGLPPALVLSARCGSPSLRRRGHIICYLRDGDRVFLTYSTTGRGNEPADTSLGLLDMTPYGRGEAWEDNPEGWPEGKLPVLVLALGRGWERHLGPDQPPRAAVDSPRRNPVGDSRPARPPPLDAPSPG